MSNYVIYECVPYEGESVVFEGSLLECKKYLKLHALKHTIDNYTVLSLECPSATELYYE